MQKTKVIRSIYINRFTIILCFLFAIISCKNENQNTSNPATDNSSPSNIIQTTPCNENLVLLIKYKLFLESFAAHCGMQLPRIPTYPDKLSFYDSLVYELKKYEEYESMNAQSGLFTITYMQNELKRNYNLKTVSQCLGLIAQKISALEAIDRKFDLSYCFGDKPGGAKQKHGFSERIRINDIQYLMKINEAQFGPLGNFKSLNETDQEADDREDFAKVKKILAKHFSNEIVANSNFQQIEKNWDAVVLVVHKDCLSPYQSKDSLVINSEKLKNRKFKNVNLCLNQKFINQFSTYSKGTGFFVSEGVIVTSGHIFSETPKNKNMQIPTCDPIIETKPIHIEDFRFILHVNEGSTLTKDGILTHKKNVFSPKWKFLKNGWYRKTEQRQDWAIVPVKNTDINYTYESKHPTLNIQANGIYDTVLYSIGYGLGLQKKFVFDGLITQNDPENEYFKCSLDLFGGNSGSPVFDASTNNVVGILVRGLNDFVQREGCMLYDVFNQTNAVGEDVQKIDYLYKQHSGVFNLGKVNNADLRKPSPSNLPLSFQQKFPSLPTADIDTVCTSRLNHGLSRMYAPYVYLNNSGSNYDLFLATPVYNSNQRLVFRDSSYEGGQLEINFVIADTGGNSFDNVARHHMNFYIPDTSWEIVVYIKTQDNFRTILDPRDADNATLTEIEDLTAYNRPYIYVTGYKTSPSNSYKCFFPYVMMPTKGYSTDSIEQLFVPAPSIKSDSTFITLNGPMDGNIGKSIFYPTAVNNYFYGGLIDGHTYAEIKLKNPDGSIAAIRKRKTRNKDADGKPTGLGN